MQSWEYGLLERSATGRGDGWLFRDENARLNETDLIDVMAVLNRLGMSGWEMVSAPPSLDGPFILKRKSPF